MRICAKRQQAHARNTARKMVLGAFLRMADQNTRNTADGRAVQISGLADTGRNGTLETVVAGLPQGSGTSRLNCYPSPDGRCCVDKRTPPFFPFLANTCDHRQGAAQIRPYARERFDADGVLSSDKGRIPLPHRQGIPPCETHSSHNPRQFSPRSALQPLPAVAARPLNRRCLAQVPGPAQPPLWTATLRLARWSARQATLPFARPSRTAALNNTRRGAYRIPAEPSVPSGAGGFVVSNPRRCLRAAGPA